MAEIPLVRDATRSEFTSVVLVHVEERSHDDAVGKLAAGETLLSLLTLINVAELDKYLKHTHAPASFSTFS